MAALMARENFITVCYGDILTAVDIRCPDKVTVASLPDVVDPSTKAKDHGKNKAKSQPPSEPANSILAAEVSSSGQYVAVCDDRKFLHVYSTTQDPWTCLSSRCVSRRCTTVRITRDETTVLVADKSGDVFAFPLLQEVKGDKVDSGVEGDLETKDDGGQTEKMETDEVVEGDEESTCGDLKLGHFSMLLDMLLIEKDGLVVTCDRDEKIRISNFPHSFDISAFCLGHTAFVMSVAYDEERKTLISGSGDCTLRLWDLTGNPLGCVDVLSHWTANTTGQLEQAQTEDPSNEEETDSNNDNSKSNSKEAPSIRPAIQQIIYCRKCSILVVAMYKSPKLLVYRLLQAEDNSLKLEFSTTIELSPSDTAVSSISLHNCVLWVACRRGEGEGLRVRAFTVGMEEDSGSITVNPVSPEAATPVGQALRTLSQHPGLLADKTVATDPVPHLWKSAVDSFVDEYKDRKRRRLAGQDQQGKQETTGEPGSAAACRWGGKGGKQARRQAAANGGAGDGGAASER